MTKKTTVAFLLFAVMTPLQGVADDHKVEEAIEEVEEVEAVTAPNGATPKAPTPAAVTTEPPKSFAPAVVGHFHPMLVHLPIGWLLLTLLVDLLTVLFRRQWQESGRFLLIVTAVSFVPAMVTGFVLGDYEEPEMATQVLAHRNAMLAAGSILLIALVLRLVKRNDLSSGKIRWLYLGLMCLSAAFMGLGGHLGGKMVHGDDFLPF